MARPSTTEFFDAAQFVYRDGSDLPSDLTRLQDANGHNITSLKRADGFYAAAFETSDHQVIVAFEGTDLGGLQTRPNFVQAQLQADVDIYHGDNPAAYRDASTFTRRALAAAEKQGISSDDVFVTGHSLGGAEAEFAAARTGVGGTTFGAPGIGSSNLRGFSGSNLTDYVDYGDPVGNYSANPNREGNFLASDDIVRFGQAKYVGDPTSVGNLELAGQLFGTSDIGDATALGILADATVDHHLLADYAADLGITPSAAQPSWMSNLDASQLQSLAAELLGGNAGTAPLAHATADDGASASGRAPHRVLAAALSAAGMEAGHPADVLLGGGHGGPHGHG